MAQVAFAASMSTREPSGAAAVPDARSDESVDPIDAMPDEWTASERGDTSESDPSTLSAKDDS
jgi:hypothetical protein